MLKESAARPGGMLALAALALLIVVLNVTPITNNDIFLHLTTGQSVLDQKAVPKLDDYSALARGRPFVAHEWLSGVIFRLVERAFGDHGLNALILFKTAIALLVAGVLYGASRTVGASPALAISSLALVMVLAAARFLERPHIFSYLMLALYLLVLARRRAKGGIIGLLLLLPLQVLWANLHGAFLLGPAIVGLAAVAEAIDGIFTGPGRGGRPSTLGDRFRFGEAARYSLLAAALLAACLLNPHGVYLLRFPFALTGSSFMGEIYEWLPPFRSAFAATYMARYYVVWASLGIGVMLVSLWLALRQRRELPWGSFPILLFAALLLLSLRMNRNVTDFAIGTMPGVACAASWILQNQGSRRSAKWNPLPWLSLVLLGLCAWFALNGYSYSASSRRHLGLGVGHNIAVGAADYLERNGVIGNAFNTYAEGAYLIYRFYPKMRVGMDSRNGVYGEELYRAYTEALSDAQAMRAMLDRIDAKVIFIQWTQVGMVLAASVIQEIGGWKPVYFDDTTVVYLREDGPWPEVVERDAYLLLNPPLFRPAALPRGMAGVALQESSRAISEGNGPYVARVMRIDALMALGSRAEAEEEELQLLAERPSLHHIYTYLGMLHLELGDREAAIDRLRRALEHHPTSQTARQLLRQAESTARP